MKTEARTKPNLTAKIINKDDQVKPRNPKIQQSLVTYQKLKTLLYAHFFQNATLKISNIAYAESYSMPYALMNNSQQVITNDKLYEDMQASFLKIYNQDLIIFAGKIYQTIMSGKGLKQQQFIQWITKWINTYTRFNHWIFRTFMFLQRNAMNAHGIRLYFYAIKIVREEIIDKIYDQLYNTIYACLQLYKQGALRACEPVQIMVRFIGVMGFTKLKMVDMVKKLDSYYEYQSRRKDKNDQIPQNPYQTGYFKKNFITRLIKDLKNKYTVIVDNMMQLSTPQYFQNAKKLIDRQEATADQFYGLASIKQIVIRNVLQTLIVQKAEQLLKNSKSGLGPMISKRDTANLVKVYSLLKKANMTRVFFVEFQNYIQLQGESILNKISSEDQRAMKKQTILTVFTQLFQFNRFIDNIRHDIDAFDAELQKAQNVGFQGFCNTGNKVCNYLAYYADVMLKKEDGGQSGQELVSQINKISKYLYSYDYFLKMHQKLLGLRILYDSFKNPQSQYALIAMLKNEAGVNATSKLSSMISDQKSSQNFNIQFQIKNKFGFTFDVMMLTSGSWEINDPKCKKDLVPPQLLPAVTMFQQKFQQKMPNRSISWIFNHGRAFVQLITNSNTKYILVLNNYQLLAVLYMQNQKFHPVKFGDLLTKLKIEDEAFFKSSMTALLKCGVVLNTEKKSKIESRSDQLVFNLDFKFKTTKVGCSIIPKYSQKNTNVVAEISAQRCILIDAILVKIMKQRRRTPYNQLIGQVQKMCKTFKAEVPQIKLRIQNCQQRNFVERDANDMNILIYKP